MQTVQQLIDELKKFPMDARAYAYEGEVTGIVIRSANDRKELGHIPARYGGAEDGGAVLND